MTRLVISSNPNLVEVDCHNNRLQELSINGLKKLKRLFCQNNQLTELDISTSNEINTLHCHLNQLTSLTIADNSSLENLLCNDNQLTQLDLTNQKQLIRLNCANNQIQELALFPNTDNNLISFIDCTNNQLTNIDSLVAKNWTGSSSQIYIDVRLNNLYCDSWDDIIDLRVRIGEPLIVEFVNLDLLIQGFGYSPQKGLDPFNCGTAIPNWDIF